MKATKIERPRRTGLVVATVIVLLVAFGVGAVFCYDTLKAVYLEQCVVTDMSAQVEITSGKMVHPSTIAEELGLRVGVNLALIDFSAKREALLKSVPNLRTVKIARRLPDKVIVTAEERTPVARMELKGKSGVSGRVVDTEGMVFIWQRGTQTLPAIRETLPPGTPKGQRIAHRTLAALRLIEVCREPAFLEFGLLEVDVSKPDYLTATLSNYSKVKIAWNEMDEHTPTAMADLRARLTSLQKAMRSRVAPETVIWNATMPDAIFADTQESPKP